MNFGEMTDEPTSFQILDAAVEVGINFVDTADVYGGPQSPDMEKGFGLSEEIIGRWMAERGSRNDIVLATKVYQPMGLGPNDRRLSALHIRRACEDSLRRLQTDHIDLYQMHHIDRFTPWEEIWQAMELLVQQGNSSRRRCVQRKSRCPMMRCAALTRSGPAPAEKRRKPTPGRGSPAIKPALFVKSEVEWNWKVSLLKIAMVRAFVFCSSIDTMKLVPLGFMSVPQRSMQHSKGNRVAYLVLNFRMKA